MSVTLKRFINVSKGSDDGVKKLLLKQAIGITSQAKRLVATDTGQLKNSIMYKTNFGQEGGLNDSSGEQAGTSLAEISEREPTAYVGTNVEHGVYEEFGTRNRKKALQPFLRPAIDIVNNRGKGKVDDILNDAMKRARDNSVKVIK